LCGDHDGMTMTVILIEVRTVTLVEF